MMNFAGQRILMTGDAGGGVQQVNMMNSASKMLNVASQMMKCCIKNEEFCIQNAEFCV